MMLAEIDIVTVLACLVGINVLLTLVLLAFWLTQRVYPGFGLWVIAGAASALAYIFVAFRASLPGFLPLVLTPALAVLAAEFRLESVRSFLGSERFDYRTLALPVVAVAAAASFAYGMDRPHIGYAVAAVEVALISWATAGLSVSHAGRGSAGQYPPSGLIFGFNGALIVAYGLYWGVRSAGSPLPDPGVFDLVFFGFLIYLDVLWAITLLASHGRRTNRELEVAQAIAERGRRQLSDIVAFLPDAVFAVDFDRRVVAWNRAVEELTGLPAEQVVGSPYDECVAKAFGYLDGCLIDSALDPARAVPERYRNVKRDGDWLSAESDAEFPERRGVPVRLWMTTGPLRDPSGTVTGAIESIRDVSQREQAAKALRESEERFRSLFEINIDGILVIAPDGTVEDANPAACAMLGMTRDEIRAAGQQGITRRDGDEAGRLESWPFDGQGREELTFVRKDGATFPADCVTLSWCDSFGSSHGFVVFRDIAEMVEAQKQLRESEARLLQAVAVSHVGNWEIDLGAQSIWLSQEALRIHGEDLSKPYLPLRLDAFVHHAEEPERLMSAVQEAMAGVPFDIEYRIRRNNDGVQRTVHAVAHTEFDDEDSPVKVVGVVQDITDLRQVEDALRLTQYSVDHAGDRVYWLDPQGRFVYVSDATCQQLGYSREEMLRMTIHDLDSTLVPGDQEKKWEEIKRAGSSVVEGVHRTKDGREIPVEASVHYIVHDGKEYHFVYTRDITERKKRESELVAAEDRIRQAQTMEAIGQLAGGIAHDFNNLLTAIIGYGNLVLASDEIQDASIRTDVEEIRAAAERAGALTRQILAFSRRQTLRPQVLSLSALTADMEPRIRETLGEGIEYSGVTRSDPCHIDVDRNQFEQVLLSLVSNARDAMPDGGSLTIEIKNVELDEEYCRVYPDARPGDYAMISVSDTGVGMTAETLSHIFEPFFTTKEPGTGTGLGLSMVYGIVRQSGGLINVYSDVGEGTTFKVYLPRVRQPSGTGEREAAPVKTVRGDETVLVVEDEDPLRRLIARVLGNLGYKVVVAGTGTEALELLEVMDRPPDLLLTDVILPGGLQGNDLARQIREAVPGLSILYMSGHTRDAIVHSGRLDEGVNFLGKPFTPEALAAKVRDVLNRRAQ